MSTNINCAACNEPIRPGETRRPTPIGTIHDGECRTEIHTPERNGHDESYALVVGGDVFTWKFGKWHALNQPTLEAPPADYHGVTLAQEKGVTVLYAEDIDV